MFVQRNSVLKTLKGPGFITGEFITGSIYTVRKLKGLKFWNFQRDRSYNGGFYNEVSL